MDNVKAKNRIRKIRKLSDCLSIEDLRELAYRRLPSPMFHFLDGAAYSEITAERNTCAFDEIKLVPKELVDVSKINMSTTVLGQKIDMPVFCAPTGMSRLFHKDGELAVARAAAKMGTAYTASMVSSFTFEEMAKASEGPKILQLYIFRDRKLSIEVIEQARTAGYKAICLTVDTAVPSMRFRDVRTGWVMPPKLTIQSIGDILLHPAWCWGLVSGGPITMASLVDRVGGTKEVMAAAKFLGSQLDASVTWKDVAPLVKAWGGPFAIKGIASPEDARRAVDAGVDTVIVSNHGGRQFDGGAAAIEMLPKIAAAVGDSADVILDGGVRCGTHVLKALALGAKACSIGRPYVYGLGAGGEEGVEKALSILNAEIRNGMALMGAPSLSDIDKSFLYANWEYEQV